MTRLPALLLLAALALAACEPSADVEEPAAPEAPAALTWEQPAWVDDAVIYELFTTDFTEEGTFRAIIPRLGELEELGVNTIWLMPIHPIGEAGRKGVLGSPYAIKDYYALNPAFGTEDDFRALVDSVHARGMHLLIDLVANHTAPDHAWVDEHPEWYTRDADGNPITPVGPDGNPTDWTDVVDLNYDDPALRAEMIRMMRYWVEEFGIDGYRCDVAGWVPDAFWEEAIAALREVKPVLMLAENEEPSIHRAGFDLTYAWPEYARLKEVWSGAPASSLVALVEEVEAALPEGAGRLRFTTNHDETAWDAPPPDLFGGQQGAQAAYVLTASLPGAPLVYNGQETGVETTVPFFEKSAYDWTARPEVRAFYDAYLDLHEASPALQDGALTFHAEAAEDAVVFERTDGSDRVLVVVNVRDRAVALPVPEVLRGDWADALGGDAVALGETLELAPYAYHVLRPSD